MFNSILILCTGNICRSPFAEAFLKGQRPDIRVDSAGLGAVVGSGADDTAKRIAAARDVDLGNHSGAQVSVSMVDRSDLILVMEDMHLASLHGKFPQARGKAFKLGKFLNNKDIADPYRKTDRYFELVFDEIEEAVAAWLPRL